MPSMSMLRRMPCDIAVFEEVVLAIFKRCGRLKISAGKYFPDIVSRDFATVVRRYAFARRRRIRPANGAA
jgi:hypothetical protein